jgi:hypothetical protein
MNRLWTMLGGMGMIVASGAIDARADDHRVALYTAPLRADTFNCNAVNVSRRRFISPLRSSTIMVTRFRAPVQLAPPQPPEPGPGGSRSSRHSGHNWPIFLAPADIGDGYCKVTVFGTDPNDVRMVLNIGLTRTIPGTSPPIFVVRSVEGH